MEFTTTHTLTIDHLLIYLLLCIVRTLRFLQTLIHLISRSDGEMVKTFKSDAFFYLHIINQYEEDDHVIIDICCYRDPSMIDCMFVEALQVFQLVILKCNSILRYTRDKSSEIMDIPFRMDHRD